MSRHPLSSEYNPASSKKSIIELDYNKKVASSALDMFSWDKYV